MINRLRRWSGTAAGHRSPAAETLAIDPPARLATSAIAALGIGLCQRRHLPIQERGIDFAKQAHAICDEGVDHLLEEPRPLLGQ
jgi:hypothetical protein